MKLLLDSCVWGQARNELQRLGHDVVWMGDSDEDPGDLEIIKLAHEEKRILVTLDKDFGAIAVFQGHPHSGILRLVNFSARQQATVCAFVVGLHGEELQAGAIVTAEPGRLRVRPPAGKE